MSELSEIHKKLAMSAEANAEAASAGSVAVSEEKSFAIERLHEEVESLKDERNRLKEEHDLRKKYLRLVFWFVVIFVASVMTIIVFCAKSVLSLSDDVQMTLLGTTTVDLVGLLYIAFNWLFPRDPKPRRSRK